MDLQLFINKNFYCNSMIFSTGFFVLVFVRKVYLCRRNYLISKGAFVIRSNIFVVLNKNGIQWFFQWQFPSISYIIEMKFLRILTTLLDLYPPPTPPPWPLQCSFKWMNRANVSDALLFNRRSIFRIIQT